MHMTKTTVAEWMRDYPEYSLAEAIKAVAEHNAEVSHIEAEADRDARTEARYSGSTFCRASR